MSALRDQFGRTIEYLRISVTDRCNFRCRYCMPLEGLPWLPKADILSYEEIRDVVAQLAPLGLKRIRITGGEPTIRPQLDTLIRFIRDVGVEDIALSTNGVKLAELARHFARPVWTVSTFRRTVCAPSASWRSRGATSDSIRW